MGWVPGDRPVRALLLVVARAAVMNQLIGIVDDGRRSPAGVRRPFMRGMPLSEASDTVRVTGEVGDPYGDVVASAGAVLERGSASILAVRGCAAATVRYDRVMRTL